MILERGIQHLNNLHSNCNYHKNALKQAGM